MTIQTKLTARYATLTPAQARELAHKLTEAARRIEDAVEGGVAGAYIYTRTDAVMMADGSPLTLRVSTEA